MILQQNPITVPVEPAALRAMVLGILQNPWSRSWTFQGLGMLRTYLGKQTRLHIWNTNDAVPGVSTIHDHPWELSSHVLSGVVRQRRWAYLDNSSDRAHLGAEPMDMHLLHCGAGGGVIEEPRPLTMIPKSVEVFECGSIYSQRREEVHESMPSVGCVTLVHRTVLPGTNADLAHVFTKRGEPWVSAEPRAATVEEIRRFTGLALDHW